MLEEYTMEEPKQQHRSPDSLIAAIDRIERLEKENKRLTDILYNISYQTPALSGNKRDMKRALLDIDYLCDLALRPNEIKEMELNNGR